MQSSIFLVLPRRLFNIATRHRVYNAFTSSADLYRKLYSLDRHTARTCAVADRFRTGSVSTYQDEEKGETAQGRESNVRQRQNGDAGATVGEVST
jgi:hypothetical protein